MKKTIALLLLFLTLILSACTSGEQPSESQITATETAEVTTSTSDAETEGANNRLFDDLPTTASGVDALIATIPAAEIAYETDIDRAFFAYWRLPEEERADVTGFETLQALRRELTKAYVVKDYLDSRVPHDKLLLGTYSVRHTDDEHLQQIADCHLDFVWFPDGDPADYKRHGLDVLVMLGSPFSRGYYDQNGNIINATTEEEARAILESGSAINYPNSWGYDLGDEPDAGEFEWMGMVGDLIREYFPEYGVFVNLFPNYASQEALHSFNYKTYIDSFIKKVKSDVVCFDHYYQGIDQEVTLQNMQLVADAVKPAGRELWVILQSYRNNATFPKVSEDMLRYQAYLALSYGCRCITWACWEDNWGLDNVLDKNGDLTDTYYRLQTVNAELKELEPIYMRYLPSSNALLCGPENENYNTRYIKQEAVETLEQGALTDFSCGDDQLIVVGAFVKAVGSGDAFFFTDSTDRYFKNPSREASHVTFRTVDPASAVVSYVRGIPTLLVPDENGVYTVEIHGSDAVFVTVD